MCVWNEAGGVPAGEVTGFEVESYSLSCDGGGGGGWCCSRACGDVGG